jgi:hypothetical protein
MWVNFQQWWIVEWYWYLVLPAVSYVVWYIIVEPFMPMILIALKYEPHGRPAKVYKIVSFLLTLLIIHYLILF